MKAIFSLFIIISSIWAWVGEISALKGDATIIRDKKSIVAKIKLKLEKDDIIKTTKNTKMQIIFKDNTVITIGKNSEVKITDYIFDNENSKANFKLSHGIMKTLTGKIGKFAPKRFKVLTKNASIGIRGTYFVVESDNNFVKVGMISGITIFTNLDNMKTYEIKKGEELIFNLKQPDKIIIKKGFSEPKEIKITPKENEIEKVTDTIDIQESKNSEHIIKNSNSKSSTFTKFLEGLKDLF